MPPPISPRSPIETIGKPKQEDRVRLEIYPQALAIGQVLPTLPLWLAPGFAVPLELEATYAAAADSVGSSEKDARLPLRDHFHPPLSIRKPWEAITVAGRF